MIAPSCKIHNDASCDISSDGKLLATFVPSAQGFPDDGVVAVYSLEKATLGQCLFAKKFGEEILRTWINFLYIIIRVRVQKRVEREVVERVGQRHLQEDLEYP